MGHAVAAQTSSRKHSFHCQTLTLPSEVPALQRGLVDTAYLERPWPCAGGVLQPMYFRVALQQSSLCLVVNPVSY